MMSYLQYLSQFTYKFTKNVLLKLELIRTLKKITRPASMKLYLVIIGGKKQTK